MPIRLVAIDLDGTLLDDAKRVSEPTREALGGLAARDARIVIASARPPRSVRAIYRQLGLDTWQINYNGALIWDEPGRQVVFHRPMPGELTARIIAYARDHFDEVLVSCEVLDRWYTDQFEQKFITETGRLFRPDVIAPLAEICTRDITKLLLLGEARTIQRLEPVLARQFAGEVEVVCTDPQLLQIMDHRVSKAAALERVAAQYGIPMSDVMAIGDAANDVEMLQAAGVAVAVGNAHTVAREAAHWIAPSNNDHGVRAALVRYGLCE